MDETVKKDLQSLREQMNDRIVQQEVLSRPGADMKPLKNQEFYELRIDDRADSWQPRFTVSEWRISWSEIDKQFMWGDEQAEHWMTLEHAKNRYETRLQALRDRGFVHSDMDF